MASWTSSRVLTRAELSRSRHRQKPLFFQMKPLFDWLSVDADRNMKMISEHEAEVVIHAKEQIILNSGIYKGSAEHKYSYSDHRAGRQGY
jgi:hypothetical protein